LKCDNIKCERKTVEIEIDQQLVVLIGVIFFFFVTIETKDFASRITEQRKGGKKSNQLKKFE
jgi:hypothetical protein